MKLCSAVRTWLCRLLILLVVAASADAAETPDASSASRFGADTSRRVTIRNCLIAECLHDSTHAKGPHSMGSLIHDFCQHIAIIGNV